MINKVCDDIGFAWYPTTNRWGQLPIRAKKCKNHALPPSPAGRGSNMMDVSQH